MPRFDGHVRIGPGDFALMVDLILGFFKNGGLAVEGAEQLIPLILETIEAFAPEQRVVIRESHPFGAAYSVKSYIGRTQDFLTLNEINAGKVELAPHAVFTLEELRSAAIRHVFQRIMIWFEHCREGTEETLLHPDLRHLEFLFEILKGPDPLVHSYSPFFDDLMRPTHLATKLRSIRARRTFSFGLAGDFCAGLCALHSAWEGFESYFVESLCRNINLPPMGDQPGTVEAMRRKLDEAGVIRISARQLVRA